jgi:hypothetical protein
MTIDNRRVEGGPATPVYVTNASLPVSGIVGGGGDASAENQDEQTLLLAALLTTTDFQARIPTVGQKAKAASLPVTLATDEDMLTYLGGAGLGPPAIVGTGMIGYQRALYDLIANNPIATVMRDGTGDSLADDANNALRVNVVAGVLGSTANDALAVSYIPAGLTTVAYASGDCVGNKQVITGGLKGTVPHAYITNWIGVSGAGAGTMNLEFHFFSSDPSNGTYTDHTAFSMNASDRIKYMGSFATARVLSGGVATLRPVAGSFPFAITHASGADFYVVIVATGAFTLPDSNNLRITGSIGY